MASSFSPWYKRLSYRLLPFLWKRCPAGNYHWHADDCCYCRLGEHEGPHYDWVTDREVGGWHGGILHFASGLEIDVTKPPHPIPPVSRGLMAFIREMNAYNAYVKKYQALRAAQPPPARTCVPGEHEPSPSSFDTGALDRELRHLGEPGPVDDYDR